jgi:hypothetical protein
MRPAEFRLARADDVTVSARTAALLTRTFKVRDLHTKLREFDEEIAVDLDALLLAAARWRERQTAARAVEIEPLPQVTSAPAVTAEVLSQCELLDTGQVADLLDVTSRAVRLACEAGRLRGQQDARGRWRISRDAVRDYQKERDHVPSSHCG